MLQPSVTRAVTGAAQVQAAQGAVVGGEVRRPHVSGREDPGRAPFSPSRNRESHPAWAAGSPRRGAECGWDRVLIPASSPLPLDRAPDWSWLPLPAGECQPLFRKCQALSDLSSNKFLVSAMLMDSQMCACVRRLLPGLGRRTDMPQLGPGRGMGEGGLQGPRVSVWLAQRHPFLPA